MFKQIHKESKGITDAAKQQYARPRPFILDSTLEPCIKKEDEPSYPSGHATRGIVYAMILRDIAPDMEAEIMERGREIGWDRVIGGVHYPSDVAAGRTLGLAMTHVLFTDPVFRRQLDIVKKEYKEARLKQAATGNSQ